MSQAHPTTKFKVQATIRKFAHTNAAKDSCVFEVEDEEFEGLIEEQITDYVEREYGVDQLNNILEWYVERVP